MSLSEPENAYSRFDHEVGTAGMDDRRRRRIISNRKSAQRARARKLQHISELQGAIDAVARDLEGVLPEVAELKAKYDGLKTTHGRLRSYLCSLLEEEEALCGLSGRAAVKEQGQDTPSHSGLLHCQPKERASDCHRGGLLRSCSSNGITRMRHCEETPPKRSCSMLHLSVPGTAPAQLRSRLARGEELQFMEAMEMFMLPAEEIQLACFDHFDGCGIDLHAPGVLGQHVEQQARTPQGKSDFVEPAPWDHKRQSLLPAGEDVALSVTYFRNAVNSSRASSPAQRAASGILQIPEKLYIDSVEDMLLSDADMNAALEQCREMQRQPW